LLPFGSDEEEAGLSSSLSMREVTGFDLCRVRK
jgi:hypothetical protein